VTAYINIEWRNGTSGDSETTYGVVPGEVVPVPAAATSMVIHVGSTETPT